jgi:hypothetical protein
MKRSSGRVLATEIMIDHLAQAPLEQVDFFISPNQGLRDILKSGKLLGRKLGKAGTRFLDEYEFLLGAE